jgi:hypothetical protein
MAGPIRIGPRFIVESHSRIGALAHLGCSSCEQLLAAGRGHRLRRTRVGEPTSVASQSTSDGISRRPWSLSDLTRSPGRRSNTIVTDPPRGPGARLSGLVF